MHHASSLLDGRRCSLMVIAAANIRIHEGKDDERGASADGYMHAGRISASAPILRIPVACRPAGLHGTVRQFLVSRRSRRDATNALTGTPGYGKLPLRYGMAPCPSRRASPARRGSNWWCNSTGRLHHLLDSGNYFSINVRIAWRSRSVAASGADGSSHDAISSVEAVTRD
jgi:hypothetical protein